MRTFSSMSQPDLKLNLEAMECLRDCLEIKLKETYSSNETAFTTQRVKEGGLLNTKLIRVNELIEAIDQEIIEY
ncbi:MAG: hypothetical protein Q8M08_04475 [Bacteroidales bacterium]|nr:hypothetical protein [Bacteroidales bacterium]